MFMSLNREGGRSLLIFFIRFLKELIYNRRVVYLYKYFIGGLVFG